MISILVNGVVPDDPARAIAGDDRGLNYGDGLFETMLYRGGCVRLLDAHLCRLASGCARLGIAGPPEAVLRDDIRKVCAGATDGVVKIVVTRGTGGRGYRPAADLCATRVVSLNAPPAPSGRQRANLRWCETRLGRNPALAGMKHLNRLEQVLAQREWNDPAIDPNVDEGLMLDTEGELISATMSNVFIVKCGAIVTPDLRFCGVRGVMRGEVLRAAHELGIPASEAALRPCDVENADEVFLTNAIRGIRSVAVLESTRKSTPKHWPPGSITQTVAATLGVR